MPSKIISMPIAFCVYFIKRFIFFILPRKKPPKKDININGKPKPKEYTNSKDAPFIAVSCAAAIMTRPVSTGPRHGVHAKAKANPVRNALKYPGCREEILNFLVECRAAGIFIKSNRDAPKIISNTPAIMLNVFILPAKNLPIKPDDAPSKLKHNAKPAKKQSAYKPALCCAFLPWAISFKLIPDIIESSPAARGKTHGEKNESTPAPKAAKTIFSIV